MEYYLGLSKGDRNGEVTLLVRRPYGEVPLYVHIPGIYILYINGIKNR